MARVVWPFLLLLMGHFHATADTMSPLSRPFRVRWYIEEDAVVVTWKHHSEASDAPIMRPMGFYLEVQELEHTTGGPLGPPDFVRVKNGSLSVKVLGMKPEAHYALKVVAFTDSEQRGSLRHHVHTKGLEFLEATDLSVSSITDLSAVFTWHHVPDNNVHDIKFKLSCTGIQHYQKKNGLDEDNEMHFHHFSSSTSRGKETYVASSLLPNTQYSCYIQSLAGRLVSLPHERVKFITEPGNPSRPPTPRVGTKVSNENKNTSFSVELYRSDEQYGPISHYVVFAVPVYRGPSAPRSAPYTPTYPYSQIVTKSVAPHLSAESEKPLAFTVGRYGAFALPEKLEFDGSWRTRRPFKPETHYAFVVAAYAKTKNSAELRYTLSEPSDPPVYIGEDLGNQWMIRHKPVLSRFLHIIVDTVVTLSCFLLLSLAILLVAIYYQRRGKKWHQLDSHTSSSSSDSDDSSEVEIFSQVPHSVRPKKKKKKKKNKRLKGGRTYQLLLSPPSADHTLQFTRNIADEPAKQFDVTVYRNPASMKEMDGLYTIQPSSSKPASNLSNTASKPSGRVDQIKLSSDMPGMPEMLATAGVASHELPQPTSPLLHSSRVTPPNTRTIPPLPPPARTYNTEADVSPTHSSRRYSGSSVAAAVAHEELLSPYTLPLTYPYEPPTAVLNSQYFYKIHKPGTPMPTIGRPKVPPRRTLHRSLDGQKNVVLVEPPEDDGGLTWQHPKPLMRVHEDVIIN